MKTFYTFVLTALLSIVTVSCGGQDEPKGENKVQITLDKTALTIEVGKTQRLTASFTPADVENTAHEWRSSNPRVATVDNTGLVTAVSAGEADITAVAYANKATSTCAVTVVDRIISPTSVRLNKTEEYILIGETSKLEAEVLPENSNAKALTWSSTDHSVATVDNDGTVYGVSAGTADITATTSNNKVAKCRITVGDKTVEITDLKVLVIDDTSVEYSFSVMPRGVDVSKVGICFDTEKTPTIESDKQESDFTGSSYRGTLSKLNPNTRYFIRAYAKGSSSAYYSATSEFTTQGSIITDFKINTFGRNRNGSWLVFTTPVISGIDWKSFKVCYGVAPNPEITDNLADISYQNSDHSSYRVFLGNLKDATTYYLRAYTITGNNVKYYDMEGHASTIGTENQRISGKLETYIMKHPYVGNVNRNFGHIHYQLPDGKYIVKSHPGLQRKIYKQKPTPNDLGDDSIYVSGGSGEFFIEAIYNYDSSQDDGFYTAYVIFECMETGVSYWWESIIQ